LTDQVSELFQSIGVPLGASPEAGRSFGVTSGAVRRCAKPWGAAATKGSVGADANAKKAELEKFRAKSGPTDPAFVERQTARHAIDVARDARIADARETAQKATRDAEVTEQAARDVGLGAALQAERKAARDSLTRCL
jgi:uncharacterized protein DUF6481